MKEFETQEEQEAYDSTVLHKTTVAELMKDLSKLLKRRGKEHDDSKLEDMEFPYFAKHTHQLQGMTYGSDEYHECLKKLKPALDHHYANNRHHTEHFPEGIQGMNLIDLIEMFVDWYCASKRHANGNIRHSIELNQKRYNISDELTAIFMNSIDLVDR